jgi:predicted nucleotidyltransferase
MKRLEKNRLEKGERLAIEEAARVIKSKFSIEEIILFGSKARGDHDAFSDIDLLLVTSDPLHWKDEKGIVEALFDIGMKFDVIFSPLFVSKAEWNSSLFTQFPIYEEIVRDGAVVP